MTIYDDWQDPTIERPKKHRRKATWGKSATGSPMVKALASYPGFPQKSATHEQLMACFAINALARCTLPKGYSPERNPSAFAHSYYLSNADFKVRHVAGWSDGIRREEE